MVEYTTLKLIEHDKHYRHAVSYTIVRFSLFVTSQTTISPWIICDVTNNYTATDYL